MSELAVFTFYVMIFIGAVLLAYVAVSALTQYVASVIV